MATRLGLVSDVHSSPAPLREALEIFRREQVDDIICAGDIAGYYDTLEPTIALLREYNCKSVIGNHDQSFLEKNPADEYPDECAYLQGLPKTLMLDIDGLRVMVVHANPPSEQHGGIKLVDQYDQLIPERIELWRETLAVYSLDVLIVGHTHQVYAERLGDVMVVNPGSTVFNHSCMILSLPDLEVRSFALEGHNIIKSWRFSMLRTGNEQNE
jgi:putative phosphoesterase